MDFKATIECEPPNKDLYKFSGLIDTNDGMLERERERDR
jgi:hypothetical protein